MPREGSQRIIHVLLWIAQVLLAAAFLAIGLVKLFVPTAEMPSQLAWTGDVPPMMLRVNGLAEVFGAVGLIAPSALRVAPRLTSLAGAGLALIMAMAMGFRLAREEMYVWPVNATLMLLSAFVAWGRAFWAPILSRRRDEAVSALRQQMANV
ncbi:MAG: DoxX family protein [Planctomycetes bacterium]|nr:DoxX family protein [Planctomycetota bacterium]